MLKFKNSGLFLTKHESQTKMTPDQKAKVEANRKRALERLRNRGILKDAQLRQIEKRNETVPSVIQAIPREVVNVSQPQPHSEQRKYAENGTDASPMTDRSPTVNQTALIETSRRPLERIRPSIRTKDYIEYDFATMKNLNGGYINPEDRSYSEFDYENDDMGASKRQKTLEDWKREQRERKYIYENAPPPEHISQAPKCTECHINIEMDPVMHDVFKLQVCKSCVKEYPEKYALLTKTESKDDYFLTDSELNDADLFHKIEKPNPHSGTFARMQLFVRCEIEQFAFKKWGGEAGLDGEWHRREEGKAYRREKKYQQEMLKMRMKTRAQEFTARLKERKHGKAHVHHFSAAIEGGTNEDGYPILRRRCIECGLETEEVSI